MNALPNKEIFKLGLTMFALFFGAGNIIFPPLLGQQSGTNVLLTILGFLITGVGLPFLGVLAVSLSGSQLQDLAGKAHPIFGAIFPIIVYLTIGPLFGLPRTATVSFEIGASPFIPEAHQGLALALFSICFFAITAWLSLRPSKITDWFGNILTPVLLGIIALIVIVAIIHPAGTSGTPMAPYDETPFSSGFVEGYLTMDALAALVFAIIIINSIKLKGISDQKTITKITLKSGVISVFGLCLVYISLAWIGTTSRSIAPNAGNGGYILTQITHLQMGVFGQILLGIAVTLACLTTAIGLTTACATYLSKIIPRLSYKIAVFGIITFTTIVANIGLDQLIAITLPVLVGIYPVAIVLIAARFLHRWFKGHSEVYNFAMLAAGFIGLFDMLKAFKVEFSPISGLLQYLPLYDEGLGWLVPAILCGLIGFAIATIRKKNSTYAQSLQSER
ncbi:branched-chain amino acid transport system II carrier protein [Aciduricibacillus chroicocephali]|uniref:Branched-chain amino acid transport system carrier protein n=1 Tax=Aciduricibacillus chroicocephali TaxID=3054939 RepID=A0ABY9KWX8_9BACI|nr:branched-chain amino acid transport system II carrier protein [Bacillaceae bacterium 44XB]